MAAAQGDDAVPERCDGCGRKAASCGMVELGWTVRPSLAGFAGAYCPSCAAALQLLPWTIQCSECGLQKAAEAAAERAGFLYFPDGLGGLYPLCGSCASAQLGHTQA